MVTSRPRRPDARVSLRERDGLSRHRRDRVKIALVQDQLLTCAGSERVFLYLVQEFAEADVYTIAYNADSTWPEFKQFRIKTSWLNLFIRSHAAFKVAFPIATYVMQWWNFRRYDLVLTSSATVAKYARRHRGRHLCYCYFPTRAIWNATGYFGPERGLSRWVFEFLLRYLRRRDVEAAQKVSRFIAISQMTREEIRNRYGRTSIVIPSPIDFDRFVTYSKVPKENFYLIVSRLETWKRVDYAVEAFTRSGRRLCVVGGGPDAKRLKAMAGPTIEFLGRVDDESLAQLYGQAAAVIFTPILEYGLVPLEANAAGTPCIAFGRGGVLETMVGLGDSLGRAPTAVFFDEQTPQSINDAVAVCEQAEFDREALVSHAQAYNVDAFRARMRAAVEDFMSGKPEQG